MQIIPGEIHYLKLYKLAGNPGFQYQFGIREHQVTTMTKVLALIIFLGLAYSVCQLMSPKQFRNVSNPLFHINISQVIAAPAGRILNSICVAVTSQLTNFFNPLAGIIDLVGNTTANTILTVKNLTMSLVDNSVTENATAQQISAASTSETEDSFMFGTKMINQTTDFLMKMCLGN